MTALIETMVARWSDPAARPLFRGSLIDDNGCCCAQGDVLRVCGWSDDRLRRAMQSDADRETAKLLGISVTHAVLLRQVNDRPNGCPQDVLAHPARILGDQAPRVLAFWRRLDGLTKKQLAAAQRAVRNADQDAARNADQENADRDAAWDLAWSRAWTLAWAVAWDAVWDTAAGVGGRATNEIQGAALLTSFRFLPLFGINDPAELDAQG